MRLGASVDFDPTERHAKASVFTNWKVFLAIEYFKMAQ